MIKPCFVYISLSKRRPFKSPAQTLHQKGSPRGKLFMEDTFHKWRHRQSFTSIRLCLLGFFFSLLDFRDFPYRARVGVCELWTVFVSGFLSYLHGPKLNAGFLASKVMSLCQRRNEAYVELTSKWCKISLQQSYCEIGRGRPFRLIQERSDLVGKNRKRWG